MPSKKHIPQPSPIIDGLDHIGDPFKFEPTLNIPINLEYPEEAQQDYTLCCRFLYSYRGSSATFNSYRRDLERLLQWSWLVERQSIFKHRREHIQAFLEFCMKPPENWIGTQNVARFVKTPDGRTTNPKWRPFVVTVSKTEHKHGLKPSIKSFMLSQPAIKSTFTALSSFYGYLVQERLVDANPVALIRQKSKYIEKEQTPPKIRRISNLQWDYVIETAEIMSKENPVEGERTLFILSALYSMYLRISELVADERSTPVMRHFTKDSHGNWWFEVTGKGNKNREITVSDDMLEALKRYRTFLNYSPLPGPNDNSPLLPKIKGRGGISSTRIVRMLVQKCFDSAYERMLSEGMESEAHDLKSATVHYLRHTGISEDVKYRPREHVRDDAGHSTMATTDKYVDSDKQERHRSGRNKRIKESI